MAVLARLEEKRIFLGSAPTSVDAIAYSFLANIIVPSLKSPLKDHARVPAKLAGLLRANEGAVLQKLKSRARCRQ
jgi:hypothetical protein